MLVVSGDHDLYFSPNGDGKYDRARFEFSTFHAFGRTRAGPRRPAAPGEERPARVPQGRPAHLAVGRASSTGSCCPTAATSVFVRAWSGERWPEAVWATQIVAVPDAGRVVLSRPVVYPAATAVTDRLAVSYIPRALPPAKPSSPGTGRGRSRRSRCAPASSSRLRTASVSTSPTAWGTARPSFFWSAHDEQGKPLPPGTYLLRLTIQGPGWQRAHHPQTGRGVLRPVGPGRCGPLQRRPPPRASASRRSSPDPACNGCGEACGPVPSDRFPDGLSFRQPCSFSSLGGWPTVRFFGASPPLTPAPADSFLASPSTGGPTTPGGQRLGNT